MSRSREAPNGANLYSESWRGETRRAFLPHEVNADRRGCPYGFLLLIGWNSYGICGEAAETIFPDLSASPDGNLTRKLPISAYRKRMYPFFD